MNIIPIKIVIADDHTLYLDGLRLLFEKEECIQVVAEATSGNILVDKVQKYRPDVVLTDLKMPEMDGLTAVRLLKKQYPVIQFIALSTFDTASQITQALDAGVSGYLNKTSARKDIIDAVNTVYKGESYYCRHTSAVLIKTTGWNINKKAPHIPNFDPREIRIIQLICEQKTSKEIADELYLAERTVQNIRNRMMDKINAKNVIGLVTYAMENGLCSTEEL